MFSKHINKNAIANQKGLYPFRNFLQNLGPLTRIVWKTSPGLSSSAIAGQMIINFNLLLESGCSDLFNILLVDEVLIFLDQKKTESSLQIIDAHEFKIQGRRILKDFFPDGESYFFEESFRFKFYCILINKFILIFLRGKFLSSYLFFPYPFPVPLCSTLFQCK